MRTFDDMANDLEPTSEGKYRLWVTPEEYHMLIDCGDAWTSGIRAYGKPFSMFGTYWMRKIEERFGPVLPTDTLPIIEVIIASDQVVRGRK